VLEAALELVVALGRGGDGGALRLLCALGFIPAVLRFALPSSPVDIRLQVGGGEGVVWGSGGCMGWGQGGVGGKLQCCQAAPKTTTRLLASSMPNLSSWEERSATR
jgi:hypothetical protein